MSGGDGNAENTFRASTTEQANQFQTMSMAWRRFQEVRNAHTNSKTRHLNAMHTASNVVGAYPTALRTHRLTECNCPVCLWWLPSWRLTGGSGWLWQRWETHTSACMARAEAHLAPQRKRVPLAKQLLYMTVYGLDSGKCACALISGEWVCMFRFRGDCVCVCGSVAVTEVSEWSLSPRKSH